VGFLARLERHQLGVVPVGRHFGEFVHLGADRQFGLVDPSQFIRVGVDVNQDLVGMVGRDQLVAVGRAFAQSGADDQ